MKLRKDQRGSVVLIAAFSVAMFMGLAAMVIDLGWLILVRSELQNAADSAALAGVADIIKKSTAEARDTALTYATLPNHFRFTSPAPASDAVDFTVVDSETLQVEVRRASGTTAGAVPTLFARIWGIKTAKVGVTAVASVNRRIIGTKPSLLVPLAMRKSMADCDGDGNYDPGCSVTITADDFAPGNFGLLRLGGSDSTDDEVIYWVENGYDQTFVIPESPGYVDVNGDTGSWGSGLEAAISSRLGDELIIPIYDMITGSGSNAYYRVVDLVGGVITDFDFSGSSGSMYITVRLTNMTSSKLLPGSSSANSNPTLFLPVIVQ